MGEQMLMQHTTETFVQRDCPMLVRFRRLEGEPAVRVGQGLAHGEDARVEVDRPPAQRKCLPQPQAAPRKHFHERPVRLVRRRHNRERLVAADYLGDRLWQPGERSRTPFDPCAQGELESRPSPTAASIV